MTGNTTVKTQVRLITSAYDLNALARRAPATDDLLTLADWLASHGAAHLSTIERIELAERLLTRRRFLVGAGALGLGVITGCGAEEDAAAPMATPADAGAGTRTVEHELGTTEVPVEPQRVVTIGNYTAEVALALEIKPVAVDSDAYSDPHLGLDGAEDVGAIDTLNLEAIAAIEPDLILSLNVLIDSVYEELSQIAPTVGIRFGSFTGEWKRQGQGLASALRGEEGLQRYNEMLAAYEQRAEEIGRRFQEAYGENFTVAIMRAQIANQRFEFPGVFSGSVLYGDVGLPLPEGLRELAEAGDEFYLEVSLEELSRGDADAIFVYGGVGEDAREQSADLIEALLEEPVFQNLRAAESDRVYAVGAHWFTGNIIAVPLILDDLEQSLLEGEGA